MNKSYVIGQIEWYFRDYKDEGWAKGDDVMDGSFAMATGGKSSKNLTAQGKETINTKGSVVPVISRRDIIKQMGDIKKASPDLYHAAEFVFSGTAKEVQEQVDECQARANTLIDLLCKR